MKNYIYIRETLDWERATYADLRDDAIRALAKLWDDTFTLSFMQCRAEIKRITMLFLKAIDEAEIITREDMGGITLSDTDIFLIADDDDWYRPDIFKLLRDKQVTEFDAAVWTDGVFGYHIVWQSDVDARLEEWLSKVKIRELDDGNAYSMIKTNNYAVTNRLLGGDVAQLEAVASHESAAKILTAADKKLLKLDRLLSLVNRHPCSYLVLNNGMGGQPDAEKLRAMVEHYVRSIRVESMPLPAAWAGEPIFAMKRLFERVLQPPGQPGMPWTEPSLIY